MGLNKPSGNMYPWAYTWTPLAGECSHKCSYCYTPSVIGGKKVLQEKYSGKARLHEKELDTKLKNVEDDKVIFVCNMLDLFAEDVHHCDILRILHHCRGFHENTYLLQTKNPIRMLEFKDSMPPKVLLGTTIESNRDYFISDAPSVSQRIRDIKKVKDITGYDVMISIEPVLDFDLDVFLTWIKRLDPLFVSIGADSKKHGLPEPPRNKLVPFIDKLSSAGIEVRKKKNLIRLTA